MSTDKAIVLRTMARYIRKHGFTPGLGKDGGPRCFIGTERSVCCSEFVTLHSVLGEFVRGPSNDPTHRRDGYTTRILRRQGWTPLDAAAVCDMAADIETDVAKP